MTQAGGDAAGATVQSHTRTHEADPAKSRGGVTVATRDERVADPLARLACAPGSCEREPALLEKRCSNSSLVASRSRLTPRPRDGEFHDQADLCTTRTCARDF
ncbi:hypothetical protein DB30_00094 [Enhygromyxa salina]|uniref:Uncharacterized protein n=1 Tax=Enhygromyxa salina TaxID=215803 RepID=A0A0C2DDR2_9BACT|nr:hypothetical protein DB30_00094 [Enhygromyxa salina]